MIFINSRIFRFFEALRVLGAALYSFMQILWSFLREIRYLHAAWNATSGKHQQALKVLGSANHSSQIRWGAYLINAGLFVVAGIGVGLGLRAGMIAACAVLTALNFYFLHMLFARVQASLLDGLVGIAILGNFAGGLLTALKSGGEHLTLAVLLLALICWMLKSMVLAAVHCKLLDIQSEWKRVGILVAQFNYSLVPALLLLMYLFTNTSYYSAQWAQFLGTTHTGGMLLLVLLTVSGIGLGCWLECRSFLAARKIYLAALKDPVATKAAKP